jgi:hypothetical protein
VLNGITRVYPCIDKIDFVYLFIFFTYSRKEKKIESLNL